MERCSVAASGSFRRSYYFWPSYQQLKALCETISSHGNNDIIPGCTEAIETHLQRAKPVWEELEEIVQSVRGPVKNKVHNARWMRKARRVLSLQEKLKEIRLSTLEILSIYTA
jgi:hypothetical protein